MTARDKWRAIQAVLGTPQDGIPGVKDGNALKTLQESAVREYQASKAAGIHSVLASSFADDADLVRFKRCKANGGTDEYCFNLGDNGIGCWGDNTNSGPPMCALPPDDMEEKWGSVSNAKHKPVIVTVNSKSVQCILGDRMPRRANIKNGAGIDLNPAACKALDLHPPMMVKATWRWA